MGGKLEAMGSCVESICSGVKLTRNGFNDLPSTSQWSEAIVVNPAQNGTALIPKCGVCGHPPYLYRLHTVECPHCGVQHELI